VIYQDPLAYLLGLEGIALLDAWAGDHDRAFTEAGLAEIRRLLDDEKLRDCGVLAERVSTVTAYRQQSAGYDAEAAAGCSRPTSRSWPSVCTAGRLSWRWTQRAGPAVSPSSSPGRGIRSSASTAHRTCSITRGGVSPEGEFRPGELDRLPLPDDSVDVIVCALALVYVPLLQPVLAEFAACCAPAGTWSSPTYITNSSPAAR
jgi:hypothetical protein